MLIASLNPWWTQENWEMLDPHLRRLKTLRYIYHPAWINSISLKPFSLNFVIGPRQVGKTTGLKLLIKKITKGQRRKDITYLDCQIFPDSEALLETLLKLLADRDDWILILDEVTTVENWWRPLKFLIDSGKLDNCVLIVSGSSSLELKKHAELFPGRMGFGRKVEVFPLSFKEFVELHGGKKKNVNKLFEKYLMTGGFLSVINGMPASEILKGFVNELIRHGRSLEISKEILSSLISKLPSALSFRAIARDTSGYSYKLVQNYMETFKQLYMIRFAYLKEGNKIRFRKERKVFFTDPLLLRLFAEFSQTTYLESAMYEGIVQEHLYRKFGAVYYYKNAYEIDVIADRMKIEVKAGKPHRRYPKKVTVLEKEEIPKFLLSL